MSDDTSVEVTIVPEDRTAEHASLRAPFPPRDGETWQVRGTDDQYYRTFLIVGEPIVSVSYDLPGEPPVVSVLAQGRERATGAPS